jgi:hypothetical protein
MSDLGEDLVFEVLMRVEMGTLASAAVGNSSPCRGAEASRQSSANGTIQGVWRYGTLQLFYVAHCYLKERIQELRSAFPDAMHVTCSAH